MPNRVKHNQHAQHHEPAHLKPRPHLAHLRRDEPGAPPAQAGSSIFDVSNGAKGITLNKPTIIWLVVVSVIVAASILTVCILLCKCKRRNKNVKRHSNGHRWHPSMEVTDGRNDFALWNRNAMPRGKQDEAMRMGTFESGDSTTPLRPAAARATAPAVMEPVVVDYADGHGSTFAPNGGARPSVKNSRYYSKQRQSWWNRISQIGRAY